MENMTLCHEPAKPSLVQTVNSAYYKGCPYYKVHSLAMTIFAQSWNTSRILTQEKTRPQPPTKPADKEATTNIPVTIGELVNLVRLGSSARSLWIRSSFSHHQFLPSSIQRNKNTTKALAQKTTGSNSQTCWVWSTLSIWQVTKIITKKKNR
jgi:hypothetical protein